MCYTSIPEKSWKILVVFLIKPSKQNTHTLFTPSDFNNKRETDYQLSAVHRLLIPETSIDYFSSLRYLIISETSLPFDFIYDLLTQSEPNICFLPIVFLLTGLNY